MRDAGALTASITGGSVGLPENVYTLDAPLDDATEAKVWTQELRLAGGKNRFHWVAGGFYSQQQARLRPEPARLRVRGRSPASPPRGCGAPKDVLFFSDLDYKLDQFALFGEGTLTVSDQLDLTAGLRYYNFSEDREQIFDGIFGNDNNGTVAGVARRARRRPTASRRASSPATRPSDNTRLNAQVSARLPAGRDQRPAQRPPLHARGPRDLQRPGQLGGRDGLELRDRLQVAGHGRPRLVQRRRSSTWTSATCRPP